MDVDKTVTNPLWEYALATYATEAVAPACLALQDRFGFDVNLLLYSAWLGQRNLLLGAEHLAALDVRVATWRNQVVRPLRSVRRFLQAGAGSHDLYPDLKALELRAEQEQLDAMYAFFQQSAPLQPAFRPVRENLETLALFTRPGDESCAICIAALARAVAGVAPKQGG